MENNKGCLIYLAISLILALVIYKVQETTLFDAFLASLGLLFGVIILIAIIAVPIEKIITSIKEQGWNIKNNDTFQTILYYLWFFVVLFISTAYNDCVKYEKMHDYHDVLYWVVLISSFIFLLFLPIIILAFVENKKLEEKQKDYDDLKEQYEYYKELLLQHKIIRYGNDDD